MYKRKHIAINYNRCFNALFWTTVTTMSQPKLHNYLCNFPRMKESSLHGSSHPNCASVAKKVGQYFKQAIKKNVSQAVSTEPIVREI